jgi:magnesium transporter
VAEDNNDIATTEETTIRRGVRTLELDDELLTDIRELIKDDARISLMNILADLHAADIAELIEHLDEQGRRYVFGLLAPPVASEVLTELRESAREELLTTITTEELTHIIGELESDDAADLLATLPGDVATKILGTIEAEEAEKVQNLMQYPEDSAGGIMTTEVLTVSTRDTVKSAIRKVRAFARQGLQLDTMYVVDENGVLAGYLPVSELILQGPGRRMGNVMKTPVMSVKADLDQEEVANIIQKYDLVSVPVTDEEHHVIGRITVDDIVDVIKEEATEDIERMAGLAGSEEASTTVWQTSRIRLPWLLVGFTGELLSAVVLKNFAATLEQIIAAAFFIPIIMAMGGNAGIQSSAIVVRGLATGEARLSQTWRRVVKEFGVGITNGIILAILIFLVSVFWFADSLFGLTLGLALLVVVLNATVVGATIPLALHKFKIDPAIATGPFITTSNDALGLLIYFGLMVLIYL